MIWKCYNFVIINSYMCIVYCVFSYSYVYGFWLYIYIEYYGKYCKIKLLWFYFNFILNYIFEILFFFCYFFYMIILLKFIGEMGFDIVWIRMLVIYINVIWYYFMFC